MPNLPEDIVDRIKALERQVRQLTTYVNTRAAAPTPPPTPAAADAGTDDGDGQETAEGGEGAAGNSEGTAGDGNAPR
ncbi:hypothetical protein [Streptomyces sp. G45]|uniref:hypothetical protein n=1 Tax=Streptomyces sp. G45 TaxID=3406627 RepID=UPI003C280DFB